MTKQTTSADTSPVRCYFVIDKRSNQIWGRNLTQGEAKQLQGQLGAWAIAVLSDDPRVSPPSADSADMDSPEFHAKLARSCDAAAKAWHVKQRHGSAADRGSADRYYGRAFDPHYFVGGTHTSECVPITAESHPAEYAAYKAAYDSETDRKDWG